MERIVEKHKASSKLYGMAGIAVGIALVVAALVFNVELRIMRIPVGKIGPIAIGAIFILVGGFLVWSKDQFCKTCDKALENGTAYMPLEAEALVTEAYRNGNVGNLMTLAVLPKNTMKMELDFSWCPQCKEVGALSVTRWKDSQPTEVGPEKELLGPAVAGFAQLVERHENERGDDDQ
jgi:hypothetical protein